jgi:GNAT superfamily N-acetyltransferase
LTSLFAAVRKWEESLHPRDEGGKFSFVQTSLGEFEMREGNEVVASARLAGKYDEKGEKIGVGDYAVDFHVKPERRRQGLGTQLYDHMERETRQTLRPSPVHQTEAGTAFWQSRTRNKSAALDEEVESLAQSIRDESPPGSSLELMIANGEPHVANIVVPKAERGKGHGHRMMTKVTDWADQKGLTVTLSPESETPRKRAALHRFYRSLGFIPASSKRGYRPQSFGSWYRPPSTKVGKEWEESLHPRQDGGASGGGRFVSAAGVPSITDVASVTDEPMMSPQGTIGHLNAMWRHGVGVTDEEQEAVMAYMGDGNRLINGSLRTATDAQHYKDSILWNPDDAEKLGDAKQELRQLIRDSPPLTRPIVVYRAINNSHGALKMPGEKYQVTVDQVLQEWGTRLGTVGGGIKDSCPPLFRPNNLEDGPKEPTRGV